MASHQLSDDTVDSLEPQAREQTARVIGKNSREIFEEASRILENEIITEQDQHKFFRNGLKFSVNEIDEISGYMKHERVIKAIAKWRDHHPENVIDGLIKACKDIKNEALAEKIRHLQI